MHSNRLKHIRKTSNRLTQLQLSELIGVPLHKIKSIESDKTKISIDIALRIEEKLNFSFKWVLTGSGEMFFTDKDTGGNDSNVTKVVIEHQDMVKRFKDPEKAKQFNEILIDIEDEDPEGYDDLFKEAKIIHKTIKRMKNQKKTSSAKKKKGNGD